jgi:hypothetical protein
MTLILYFVPAGVFIGIAELIFPELASLGNVPITAGLEKDPVGPDSCAV